MDKLIKLITDIGKLWENYHGAYFTGIQNTLILAVAATLAGCLIGLLCGVGDFAEGSILAGMDLSGITCEVVGDSKPVSITVEGNTVTLILG